MNESSLRIKGVRLIGQLITLLFLMPWIASGRESRSWFPDAENQITLQRPAVRVDSLLKAAKTYRLRGNYTRNRQLIQEAKIIADQQGSSRQQAEVFGELSRLNLYDNAFSDAKAYADSAMLVARASADKQAFIMADVALATYYNYLSIRDLAVDHAQHALSLLGTDTPTFKPRIYYILYGVYSSWDDVELTNKYARLTVTEALKVGDRDLLGNGYTAQSVGMELRYQQTENRAYLDSMLAYLHNAADLFSAYPDQVSNQTYAIANLNIANYYYQYHPIKEKAIQDSVVKYASLAGKAVEQLDFNFQIRGNVNGLMAELALQAGDFSRAERYLLDAYEQVSNAEHPPLYSLLQLTNGLSKLYEQMGRYDEALRYAKLKETYNSSIFDQNQVIQAQQLEAKYENKAILAEMEVVKEREQNRKVQNLLFLGIAVLAVVSLVLLYYSFRNKTKLYAEHRLRLQKEKEEAVAMANMKEQEKRFLLVEKAEAERNALMQLRLKQEEEARLTAEQELLRMQKEQLRREALADALQIDRKNQLLRELKDRFDQLDGTDVPGTMDKILRDELRNEEILDKSAKEFRDIHPAFFLKLKALSTAKLTELDLKYCAYIHLKLSTKEISSVLNVAPKSVRMSKYRIKQKLNLSKEDDLDLVLQELMDAPPRS
ncbi:hypothetical protein [Parapedobacter lycopersici]|uniref:hypothetical protein n=1 Tax=Parapedobacter lycopersici TaxID=1864939 RepID=UPI00333EB185